MIVLIDTNVVLDVILTNAVFSNSSRVILDYAEQKRYTAYVSASAITDIFYIAQKKLGKKIAKDIIKELLYIFYPATVTDSHIFEVLNLEWADFEDSVQFVVGEGLGVDYIITRNTKDFSVSNIPAIMPEQFIEIITKPE